MGGVLSMAIGYAVQDPYPVMTGMYLIYKALNMNTSRLDREREEQVDRVNRDGERALREQACRFEVVRARLDSAHGRARCKMATLEARIKELRQGVGRERV